MKTIISDEEQSKVLDSLRFPLACLVVIIHCKLSEDNLMPQWDSMTGNDFAKGIQIIFSSIISGVAVPIFFIISGYYFYYCKNRKEKYIDKLKKRFRSLFLPYILWNTILILKYILIKLLAVLFYDRPLTDTIHFFKSNGGIHMFWDCYVWSSGRPDIMGISIPSNSAPFLFPLWYVRDLMIVVLFSPILYWLIKRFGYWILLMLAIFYITGLWVDLHGFSVISFFFFSVGAYFSIHKKNMVWEFSKYTKASWILYIVLFFYLVFMNTGASPQNSYIYSLFIIVGVVSIINLSLWLYKKGKLKQCIKLKETTFYIYTFHLVAGTHIASIILDTLPLYNHWISTLLYYVLKPILTVLVCIFTYYMLKKYFPIVLDILTGMKNYNVSIQRKI